MRKLLLSLLFLTATISNAFAFGGGNSMSMNGDERGGGDFVYCYNDSTSSNFHGYYTLDFLLNRENDFESNRAVNYTEGTSWKEVINSITKKLNDVAPNSAYKGLNSYMKLLENHDWAVELAADEVFRYWEPTLNLLDYKDEEKDRISKLPKNCYSKETGKVNISQVVLRTDEGSSIVYSYDKELFNNVKKTNPLQFSYLVVHEWLRDYSFQSRIIRRVNNYLHSTEFQNDDKYVAALKIARMGLSFRKGTYMGDRVSLMNFQTGAGKNCGYDNCGHLSVHIKVKNLAYNKHVGVVFSENGGSWHYYPAKYVRELDNGFEEWEIETPFSTSGTKIEFALKYEVNGEIFWDNNNKNNYSGVFKYPSEE